MNPVGTPKLPADAILCFAPLCDAQAWHMPVIFFGPGDDVESALAKSHVCRLEVPKLACHFHKERFNPDQYLTQEARFRIQRWIRAQNHPIPSFKWFEVMWLGCEHRIYAELGGGGEARLTCGENYAGV